MKALDFIGAKMNIGQKSLDYSTSVRFIFLILIFHLHPIVNTTVKNVNMHSARKHF